MNVERLRRGIHTIVTRRALGLGAHTLHASKLIERAVLVARQVAAQRIKEVVDTLIATIAKAARRFSVVATQCTGATGLIDVLGSRGGHFIWRSN
jgi:hypothetical protein